MIPPFCLYLVLAGATVLLFGQTLTTVLAVGGFVAFTIASFWVWLGPGGLAFELQWGIEWTLGFLLPVMLLVVGGAVLFLGELTGRERTQRLLHALEMAHRHPGAYAAKVEELTVANECQRLARELHDTLAQGLAGVILQLEAGEPHLDVGNSDLGRAIVHQALARRARRSPRPAPRSACSGRPRSMRPTLPPACGTKLPASKRWPGCLARSP